MPSQRPSAAFDPISPDLNVADLVEETPNFEYVTRVPCEMVVEQSLESFEKLVLLHVIIGGKPLVIEGFQNKLDEWTFTSQWLQDNWGNRCKFHLNRMFLPRLTSNEVEQARNLSKQQNIPLSMNHYLRNMSKLANQWTNQNYKDADRQRIYLKDIDCPDLWRRKLEEQMPLGIFYMNDSTGEIGGPGADGPGGRGVARAGDLMSSLPTEMRADNLMCYIGHEGTYTPAHREMCASLGQNIMVEASGSIDEEGKPAKPGSSIWFMTESKDRHLVSEYWLGTLGHDIEIEKHFAQINAWKAAPFKVYVAEQRVGDFILIPPLAPHQVWNRGTRTMKVAWNRTTVETLEMAIDEAIPRARMVCRDEQYKNKAIVYFTLEKYSDLLGQIELRMSLARNPQDHADLQNSNKIRQLQKDFIRLFSLFTKILISEMLSPVSPHDKRGQYIPYDGYVTCSYCRCNIFNRFLTCTSCIVPLPDADEDTYDICLDCFAMGRSCSCISDYKWVEQFNWSELIQKHESWRRQILGFEGNTSRDPPKSLQEERKSLQKKTLAQVCQEQLKLRPWSDPKNPRAVPNALHSNGNADEDGKVSRKDRLDKKNFCMEHVALHPREKWKCAACNKCDRSYSYGSLWRMFDLMPLSVMEQYNWECPFCCKICSCGSCRRRTGMIPYEPKGTVLGHDTKKIADLRSVEHLVDFSHSNMNWIKTAGDDHPSDTRRLQSRIEEAERLKASDTMSNDHYVDTGLQNPVLRRTNEEIPTDAEIPIDPLLSNTSPNRTRTGSERQPPPGLGSNNNAISRAAHSGSHLAHDLPEPTNTEQGQTAQARERNFVSNGITYEYPDPEETVPISAPTYAPPQVPQKQATGTEKRKSFILQSDVANGRQDDSNEQFRQAQRQKALREAKLNNRQIIADAALTGKSLVVSLSLPRSRLATLGTNSENGTGSGSVPEVGKDQSELIQSDLPSMTMMDEDVDVSRKRKDRAGDDDDDEYRVRKRRDRPSASAAAAASVRESRRAQTSYAEDESESDFDEIVVDTGELSSNKSKGPRSIPQYLANRYKGQNLPEELATPEPRARPKPKNMNISKGGRSPASKPAPPPKSTPQSKLSPVATSRPQSSGKRRGRPPKSSLTSAQKLAEENRKAKLKAVSWADGGGGEDTESSDRSTTPPASSDGETPEPPPAKAARPGPKPKPMAVPTSIFSRPGMAGRKIKIASAKMAAAITGKV